MPETAKHRRAFDIYWRLGPERSIERLHAELAEAGAAPTLRTLYEWSSRYHWQDRLLELEQEAQRVEDEARIAALRQMQDRQTKEGLLLQQKGAEWLSKMDDKRVTADAATRAVVEGARLERLARGEVTERKEIRREGEEANERLAELTDEELKEFIQRAEGLVDGKGQEGSG